MAIDTNLVNELVKDCRKPEDLLGEDGLLSQLTKAVLERALEAEMTEHLGYSKHDPVGRNGGNSRNGKTSKSLVTDRGPVEIVVPRDREGTFKPLIVPKGQRRFVGFDDKIISLYARGLSTRDIQAHLQEIYGMEISPSLVSNVTDAVVEEVKGWQTRPLEPIYPIVYMDCLFVKGRENGQVINKAVYAAVGINLDGRKDALGLWIAPTEGAKFWLQVLTELKNRGVQDIFIVCVDGLKGFPEAIEAVYPKAQVQLCMVHLVRHSLSYVGWKQRKAVATDLKAIYQAATVEEAELELDRFGKKWDSSLPTISQAWRRNWPRIIPLFGYPPAVRRVIYTTNAIESLNASLRRVIRQRGSFPSDEAITKLLYLALRNITRRWAHLPLRDWKDALNHFAIIFEGRIPTY